MTTPLPDTAAVLRAIERRFRVYGPSVDAAMSVFVPVLEVDVKYLKPAFYDDTLTIVTTLGEKPVFRIQLAYEVLRGDELLATGHTAHAFIDREGRPVRPPPHFSQRMSELFK